MATCAKTILWVAVFFIAARTTVSFGKTREVTSLDCVQVRYIEDVWINPQGTAVAYLVKVPNVDRNRNDYQLYVRELNASAPTADRLVLAGEGISDVTWLSDGNRMAMLISIHGVKTIAFAAVDSDKQEIVTEPRPIKSYSVDASGDTMVYEVADNALGVNAPDEQVQDRIAAGYRVVAEENRATDLATSSLYVRRRAERGEWSQPTPIAIQDPFDRKTGTHFPLLSFLNLAPNGKRLLFSYGIANIPADWKKSPYVRNCIEEGNPALPVLVLYDFEKDTTGLAFKTVWPDSKAVWSHDSRSFLVNAHSPVGSIWEQEDIRARRIANPDANMFWVDADTGRVEEVYRHVPSHHERALFWRDDGDIILHGSGDSVLRLHRDGSSWREVERIVIPGSDLDRFSSLASAGKTVVGVRETVTIPEELFIYEPGMGSIRILTDLNPQLKSVRFAPVETIHWPTSSGLDISGLLFTPPDYAPGKRYPLVIQTKGDAGWFTCDSGQNHDPAFAPQPIASAGMMYLIRTVKEGFNYEDEISKQPKGYPGQIGEAVQAMDIWDSAVKALSKRGMIDPGKVGIIGFSRTGWHVEYILAHSPFHYAAATVADNVQYSLSEYWLHPNFEAAGEAMFDGPPYGNTLDNWEKYSISFNLEKVHTPILLEEMGYGAKDDVPGSTPDGLSHTAEILNGLTRLGRPVELYYYPNEDHQPDHPKARLGSLERNVDWYRFWLQDYEDPAPQKAEQYARWRRLKSLHIQDLKTVGESTSGQEPSK
jgi:dipeptidyl aminopeptidase/acylaminoacyl peptidase